MMQQCRPYIFSSKFTWARERISSRQVLHTLSERLACPAMPQFVLKAEGDRCHQGREKIVFDIRHGHFADRIEVFVELKPLQIKS